MSPQLVGMLSQGTTASVVSADGLAFLHTAQVTPRTGQHGHTAVMDGAVGARGSVRRPLAVRERIELNDQHRGRRRPRRRGLLLRGGYLLKSEHEHTNAEIRRCDEENTHLP